MISLKELEHSYLNKTNERMHLKDVNLNIAKGDIYCIVGKPESGKNELLRCINLMNQPTSGLITIDQQNLNSFFGKELNSIRRTVSMLTKSPCLLSSKTVYDNIALPLQLQSASKNDIFRIVQPILIFTGITDKAQAYPNSLSTLYKHIVAIARALVTQPKVLLFEDITSTLDNKSSHTLINLILSINKEFNITMLFNTHDIEVIKSLSNKIIVMDKGRVVEECSAHELFYKPKTEVAKDFIKAITRHEMPWVFRKKISFQQTANQHPILRLSFISCVSPEYILGQIIENYQYKINIIQAYQEHIQCKAINIILAEVQGNLEYLIEIIEFLNDHELHVETLGYVTNNI